MKKTTIALACSLAAFSATALAQTTAPSALTIYGDLDVYGGYIRSNSGAHVTGLNDGSILRSRLGFRGAEALAPGYEAKFNLELGLNADTGTGADTSRLFDRQAWVGINTPGGEFRVGRQNTEIFLIGGAIDYTERTTFGSIINTFGVPSRYDNDISYKTPRIVRRAGRACITPCRKTAAPRAATRACTSLPSTISRPRSASVTPACRPAPTG